MPSGELYTAAEARAERDQEMSKRGRAIPKDFVGQGISMAKAKKMAKAANAIVKLLKPLSYEERCEVLSQYQVLLRP